MNNRRFVYIEMDTGGPSPADHSVVRIGLHGGGAAPEQFIVRDTDIRILPSWRAQHGIGPRRIENEGIPIERALRRILSCVSGSRPATLVGWHVGIDVSFLLTMASRSGRPELGDRLMGGLAGCLDLPSMLFACSEAGMLPDGCWESIESAADMLGVELGGLDPIDAAGCMAAIHREAAGRVAASRVPPGAARGFAARVEAVGGTPARITVDADERSAALAARLLYRPVVITITEAE